MLLKPEKIEKNTIFKYITDKKKEFNSTFV